MINAVILRAGGRDDGAKYEEKIASRNENSFHSLLARLNWSREKIFDLQTKLVRQKTKTEDLLFQARMERDKEKQRSDGLERQLTTEREKGAKLQELFRKTKKENHHLWKKAEDVTRRMWDLQEKIVASNERTTMLVIEMKQLQREVNAVRKLPEFKRRYKELQKEEFKGKAKEIGTRVGNAFIYSLPFAALTVGAMVVWGPVGIVGIIVASQGAITGALQEVPEDPKKVEREVEMKKLQQEITYIRTGTA